MSKNISSPKSTGGGGYNFEDNVVAYFLSCLLSGHSPFSQVPGTITAVDFQVRVDGWYLDDTLLTLIWQGETSNVALSFKSNSQFTQKTAPQDFVRAAWEQYLHIGTNRFDKDKDTLAIVVAPLAPELSTAVQTLLRFAREQVASNLPERLRQAKFTSDIVRNLFKSFACPSDLAQQLRVGEEHIGDLLARLQVMEADFDKGMSAWYGDAIRNCRAALRDPALENARALWEVLLGIAKQYRPSAGHLDFPILRTLVPSSLQLAGLPNYSYDWTKLIEVTEAEIAQQRNSIGGTIHLSRSTKQREVRDALEQNSAVALLGPSGSGKSALAKEVALGEREVGTVLWLNAQDLDVGSFTAFVSWLGLKNSLREVLANVPSKEALFVLDAVDRLYRKTALENLSTLINALMLGQDNTAWKLLIPCQVEAWQRVQYVLAQVGLYPKEVHIDEPLFEELAPVWDAYPNLRRLSLQPDLQSLLRKPKVLDLLATKLSLAQGIDPTSWVGESDLVDWFWQVHVSELGAGAGGDTCLLLLAEKQADDLRMETALVDLSFCSADSVRRIIQDGISKEREGRISFEHDLYGDWFRQRLLVSRFSGTSPEGIREYFDEKRLASPLWHRAIRLYGLYLIEKYPDLRHWKSAFQVMASQGAEGSFGQDLLLQAALLAANPLQLLQRMWSELIEEHGFLLKRLLGSFLHDATLPNKDLLEAIKESAPDRQTEATTYQRVPIPIYWAPMLRFLYSNKEVVLQLAPDQLAQIVDKWLSTTAESMPLRKEAAEMALDLAERVMNGKEEGTLRRRGSHRAQETYHAALAGVGQYPERVAAFSMLASRRIQDSAGNTDESSISTSASPVKDAYIEQHPERAVLFRNYGAVDGYYEITPHWADGPFETVDEDFRFACLQTDGLYPLIDNNPALAREVLLALLIEPPRERERFGDHRLGMLDELEIVPVDGWYPPIFTDGPFLYFLTSQPNEGLESILRLVNFATERWADKIRSSHNEVPTVTIPTQEHNATWVGNSQVYYWYEDHSRAAVSVIAALMALEKWLYDELSAKRDIRKWLTILLERSASVAFAGVLSAVARKEPSLLSGPLRVLLGVPEFLVWELHQSTARQVQGSGVMMGWLLLRDQQTIDRLYDWRIMPHRARGLSEWAVLLFLTDREVRTFLEASQPDWMKRLQRGSDDAGYIELLLPQFDLSNYEQEPDGSVIYIPPDEVRSKLETNNTQERLQLTLLPHQCRALLDGTLESTLTEVQLEELWRTITRFAEQLKTQDDNVGVGGLRDAIFGSIAVLFRLHRSWLRSYPEREAWCRERIIEALSTPVILHSPFEDKWSHIAWRWDRFVARTLPMIWVEDVDDPDTRELIARMALSISYETVSSLCSAAAEVRHELGDNFNQLLHLIVRVAVARREVEHPERNDGIEFSVDSWLTQSVEDFCSGALTPEIPPWEDIVAAFRPIQTTEATVPQSTEAPKALRYSRRSHELDVYLLQAAYDWLPALQQAGSTAERSAWLAEWQQMLRYLLHVLGAEKIEVEEVGGTPEEWDRWLLEHIAGLLFELDPEEDSEVLWMPILELGARGHYRVSVFLREWFRPAFGSCSRLVC
jgi:hypothetical protein